MNDRKLDLLCMGRAAVDLYADQIGAKLENASTFSKYVGGCAANIAIGGARLGLKTGMLTRVGKEAMGQFILNTFEKEGVDTSKVTIDPEHLTGLVLLGVNPPNDFPLIFYRENCADMAISSDDFSFSDIAQTKAILITGTHCSTPATFSATQDIVKLARTAGTQIIFDIDYRPVLWNVTGIGDGANRFVENETFSKRVASILGQCDLIVGTTEEFLIASNQKDIGSAIGYLREMSSALLVLKRGELGSILYPPDRNNAIPSKPFKIDVLNVLGAGDAFLAGFLRGWLQEKPLDICSQWANANGALVVSRHGCAPAMPYWEELQAFLHNTSLPIIHRLHESHQQKQQQLSPYKNMAILAIDHRNTFKSLQERYHKTTESVTIFKSLVLQAVQQLHKLEAYSATIGIILDDHYCQSLFSVADNANIWCARAIETASISNLDFFNQQEASACLRYWPKNHTVKVLCRMPADVTSRLFQTQLSKLKQLFYACQQWQHQLIIELLPIQKENNPGWSVAQIIEKLYQAEIYPTWWKLPPNRDIQQWQTLETIIQRYDPMCCGVLLLGQNQSIDSILPILRDSPYLSGFAIGRTIWGEIAQQWFADQIDDKYVINTIYTRFNSLLQTFCSIHQESFQQEKLCQQS